MTMYATICINVYIIYRYIPVYITYDLLHIVMVCGFALGARGSYGVRCRIWDYGFRMFP